MSGFPAYRSSAIGLDHIGIVGADLGALAGAFCDLGFAVTPRATHASGRTANRCVMLRDGGYLELIATVPGQASATVSRFLSSGPGAHILALEVNDEAMARDRLLRAGVAAGEVEIVEREANPTKPGVMARFALVMPPDIPEGRISLIRHLTRDLLWRPEFTAHENQGMALIEAVFASPAPAETMTRLSRISGRPAEPDLLGGYRIALARGCLRILPQPVAETLFPGATDASPLVGLTIAGRGPGRIVRAGGVGIRFVTDDR
jgi:hypothetical protein